MDDDPRTPEGRLVAAAIERSGRSIRSVAREVPISDTRLRQWYLGRDQQGDVRIPARQLARLAKVLSINADLLRKADRADAAAILLEELDEAEIQRSAGQLTMEEIARQLAQMARRVGELEQENQDLRSQIEQHEDRIDGISEKLSD